MCNLSEGIFEKGVNKGKMEAALEMLKDGLSFETVAKYTKLSLKVIENLAKKNKLI